MSICKDGALCKKWLTGPGNVLSYLSGTSSKLVWPADRKFNVYAPVLQLSFYLQVLQSQKGAGQKQSPCDADIGNTLSENCPDSWTLLMM